MDDGTHGFGMVAQQWTDKELLFFFDFGGAFILWRGATVFSAASGRGGYYAQRGERLYGGLFRQPPPGEGVGLGMFRLHSPAGVRDNGLEGCREREVGKN